MVSLKCFFRKYTILITYFKADAKEEVKDEPVDDFALDLGKKKKKKKRFVGLDDEAGAEMDGENRENQETVNQESKPEEDGEDKKADDLADDLDFTLDLGKKKKKKKKFGLTPAPGEEAVEEDNDPDSESANAPGALTGSSAGTSWADSDRDYTYDELLQHVFNIIREKNPDLIAGEKKKMVMRPPQVLRVGTKKTSFANFLEICKS